MGLNPADTFNQRIEGFLQEREEAGTLRKITTSVSKKNVLDLSNNDYLSLAKHPLVCEAASRAIEDDGCSASASPLLSGFGPSHELLKQTICNWFESSASQVMIWNSGYSANQSIFKILPQKGDLVLADKLIHESMISGILSSGARLIRYPHLDLGKLESLLTRFSGKRMIFLATESLFGMDGDYPDLRRISELRERFPFFWILDEAHALGWYGKKGTGLAEEQEVFKHVDLIIGTMGKALGSSGAFTVFKNAKLTDYLINKAGHFIYSTFLAPSSALAAVQAIELINDWQEERKHWQEESQSIRCELIGLGHSSTSGDSPIIPLFFDNLEDLQVAKENLLSSGIKVSAIRPPTVPPNSPRIRISLKRELVGSNIAKRIHEALK